MDRLKEGLEEPIYLFNVRQSQSFLVGGALVYG